tara:strand:+ start:372 stop:977 length:606 start_codon:yes stop_codon:yes gene_type:complete
MSIIRKHLKKSEKTQHNPLTILTNLGAWISRQKVEFNPVDMRITLERKDTCRFTCLAIVYDSEQPNDMSDEFWENANGCRYVVRMNISILGFEWDDADEFIGTNDPSHISGADLSLMWAKLVNYVYHQDDEDLYMGDLWHIPFPITFDRGSIFMSGIRIGHQFNDNGTVRLIDYGESHLFIEDATIPKILCSFVELYFPTY